MVPGSADGYSPSLPGMSTPGGSYGSMPAMGTPGSSSEPGGYAAGGASGFKVIALKHARAQELAATLKQLLGNVQVVGDARSNSIVLKADPAAAREIEELIRKLDVQGVDETGGSGGDGWRGSAASWNWWPVARIGRSTTNPGHRPGFCVESPLLRAHGPCGGPPSRSLTASMIQRLTSRSMSEWMR